MKNKLALVEPRSPFFGASLRLYCLRCGGGRSAWRTLRYLPGDRRVRRLGNERLDPRLVVKTVTVRGNIDAILRLGLLGRICIEPSFSPCLRKRRVSRRHLLGQRDELVMVEIGQLHPSGSPIDLRLLDPLL